MEDNNELVAEIKDYTREELETEYLDLHAAYLAAEKEIGRLQRIMQDIGCLAAEGTQEE